MIDLEALNKKLDSILERQRASQLESEQKRKNLERERLIVYGLRGPEAESWLDQEPTFPKDIAYPTGVNRDTDPTRRKQNQIPLCLNE